ncbi:MAG: protein translocase subunit SecD, partial [Treponema sp.]|nr:protein translocase subunit SecD [Candidatus Treponema equi]
MNKKSRLVVILAVLAVCFAFLWPTISWYARTPKEDQGLALSSLESIKDYSSFKAASDVKAMVAAVKADPETLVAENQAWMKEQVKKNYKLEGKVYSEPLKLNDALNSFASKSELVNFIEGVYRKRILKNKDYYKNSVKLGLDLSGGMNVIVKADLDAVIANQGDNPYVEETLKAEAMAQAVETLTSRIDRFGLSSPTIRQQGEDRIYIELPGSAEADQINSIIQGRGILNFRLVDNEATNSFTTYYYSHMDSTFDSKGRLIDASVIPEDCEVMGYYSTDAYGLDQREGYLVVKKEIALDG